MIQTVIENDPRMAADMVEAFALTEDDLDVITGGKKIKLMKKKVAKPTELKQARPESKKTEETKQTLLF
jgi:hypothetical protein